MNLIGIYYPGRSFWHRLDPRSKLAVVLAMMFLLLASRGIKLGLICIMTFLLYRSANLPWRLELEVIKKFKWLLLIPLTVNLAIPFHPDGWHRTLAVNSPAALNIGLRLAAILLVAGWLSYVTKPMTLVEGIAKMWRPFKSIRKSGFDIPLMMGLVVRFIPELLAESENITVAQRIRGIKPGLRLKNSLDWIKSTIIPVFLAAIRKAVALATAMEARGYRPGMERSPIEEIKLKFPDYLVIGIAVSLIVGQTIQLL